jgi:hypothetical protein
MISASKALLRQRHGLWWVLLLVSFVLKTSTYWPLWPLDPYVATNAIVSPNSTLFLIGKVPRAWSEPWGAVAGLSLALYWSKLFFAVSRGQVQPSGQGTYQLRPCVIAFHAFCHAQCSSCQTSWIWECLGLFCYSGRFLLWGFAPRLTAALRRLCMTVATQG